MNNFHRLSSRSRRNRLLYCRWDRLSNSSSRDTGSMSTVNKCWKSSRRSRLAHCKWCILSKTDSQCIDWGCIVDKYLRVSKSNHWQDRKSRKLSMTDISSIPKEDMFRSLRCWYWKTLKRDILYKLFANCTQGKMPCKKNKGCIRLNHWECTRHRIVYRYMHLRHNYGSDSLVRNMWYKQILSRNNWTRKQDNWMSQQLFFHNLCNLTVYLNKERKPWNRVDQDKIITCIHTNHFRAIYCHENCNLYSLEQVRLHIRNMRISKVGIKLQSNFNRNNHRNNHCTCSSSD